MTQDQIAAFLRQTWRLGPESALDFEWTDETTFRATEVRPDMSLGKSMVGYLHGSSGFISMADPQLSFEQARVYDGVTRDFQDRIDKAEAAGEDRCLLMLDGSHPELFNSLSSRPSIAGCAKDGMLEAWIAVEHDITARGWEDYLTATGDGPWQLWAKKRGARLF